MVGAKSTVKINRLKLKQLTRAQIQALEMTAEALHTEVVQAQVVPFNTGNTQNESQFVDYSQSNRGKASLCYSNPYARRIYFHPEYNFKTDENPNAQGLWLESWIDGKKKYFCSKTFKELYKRLGGV